MKNPILFARAARPALTDLNQLVEIDTAVVPAMLSALQSARASTFWPTPAPTPATAMYLDSVVRQQEALLMGIGVELLNQNDRLYALLATSLRGEAYTAAIPDSTGRLAYTPVIPDLPPGSAVLGAGLQASVARRLDRVTLGIGAGADGDAFPADDILTALRGTTPADSDRNVIDLLGEGGLTAEEKESLLTTLLQIAAALI